MLSKMSNSEEQREFAEARRKALLDYNTNMIGAREEGFAEGYAEGITEGQNTIMRAMLIEFAEFKFDELPEWASNIINAIPPNEVSKMMTQAVAATMLEEWLKT